MALTWRNVDAPDFRSSVQGYETFSNLLGRAFGGLQQGLDRFDASQDKRVNTELAMNLLRYQDAAKYKDALSSGSLFAGVDPRRISAGTLAAAGARSTDLINQAVGEQNLAEGQYRFGRTKDINTRLDAAAPLVPGAISAARNGQNALNEFIKNNPALAGLPYDQAVGLANNALNAEQTDVQIDTGRQNYSQGAQRFGWEREDRATAEEADRVFMDISQNAFDQETAMSRLNGMKNINPKVYGAIQSRIQGSFPGTPAAEMISGAVGGGGGSGDPTRIITGGGEGNLGIGYVPPSVTNLGQAVAFGKDLNRRGQASSAMGVYQITQSTMEEFAPKALGNGWQNQPFDFASQDAVARKIFEASRGSADALRGRWVSLSPAQAEAVRKMPWEQARVVIARGESGADPRTLALGNAIVNQGITTSNMERNANTITSQYAKSAQDARPVADIAAELSKDPSFKGMNLGEINENIQSVIAEARRQNKTISAAVARDILKESLSSTWASRNLPSFLGGGDREGMTIDRSRVNELISSYSRGDVDRAVAGNANAALQVQTNQAAAAQFAAAQSRYQRGLAAARQGRNVDLAALQADVRRAEAAYAGTLQAAGADRGVTSFGRPENAPAGRPAPRPVAPARPLPPSSSYIPGRGPLVGNLTPEQQRVQDMLLRRYSGRTF